MEIQYVIEANDYLQYQLYRASTLPKVKIKRIKEWLITPFTFFCLAFLFSTTEKTFLMNYFLVLGFVATVCMPFYTAWRYKRHYKQHVNEVYKHNFGKMVTIRIMEDYIEAIGEDGETKFKLSQISEINEITDYYFLQFASGPAVIISKQKTINRDELVTKIQQIAIKFNVKHNINLNWKWK